MINLEPQEGHTPVQKPFEIFLDLETDNKSPIVIDTPIEEA
jgi:hypothetical protein